MFQEPDKLVGSADIHFPQTILCRFDWLDFMTFRSSLGARERAGPPQHLSRLRLAISSTLEMDGIQNNSAEN
jgi:hypothetical protein